MKKLFLWALSALLTLPAAAQDFVPEASFYGENYWTPDTLGNHRAIVSVNTPASVAEAYIPWRRRDANPEQKGIIVINVSTGKAVDNVLPVEINREYLSLIHMCIRDSVNTDASDLTQAEMPEIIMCTTSPTTPREGPIRK